LVSFRLIGGVFRISPATWHNFMVVIQESLTRLHINRLFFEGDSPKPLLPLPLRRLKSLSVGWCNFDIDQLLLENLENCRALEFVSFTLDKFRRDVPNEILAALNEIRPLKVKINLEDVSPREFFDDFSRIKFVDFLSSKLTSVVIRVIIWNRHWTTALDHIIRTCHDLEEFEFIVVRSTDDSVYELKKANLSLYPLFSNKERARKLRKLCLTGDLSDSILNAISVNCVNVTSLKIWNCDQLNDAHLMLLADRGVALRNLMLVKCPGVGDDGLIPILVRSGMQLEKFYAKGCGNVTRRTFLCLFEFCRCVQRISLPDDMQDMKDLIYSKCFNAKFQFTH